MTIHSLRLRMMGLAVLWVLASLLAAGLALQFIFGINLERTAREDMDAALSRLAAVIDTEQEAPSLAAPLPDPRYATPFSGRYWQIEDLQTGRIGRSRSLWDFIIDAAETDGNLHHASGPEGRPLMLLSSDLEITGANGPRSYRVTVGQDRAPFLQATQRFGRDLMQVLTLLGALIVVMAWMQIKVGLAPIRNVEYAIEQVRHGHASRMEGTFPTELQSMVQEVNELLEARDVMMDRARARAADLAHGLKTPLAAVHGIADRLREGGNAAEADLLSDLSTEMSERVDYQMRLAALRLRTSSHSTRSSLNTTVLRTLTVLKKTGRGESLHWSAELADDCWVDIHRQDLLELVGVTLENAAKWATSRVVIRSKQQGDKAILEICDDGPGIPDQYLNSLGVRGLRLDQSLPGTGLGLAIAAEIVQINQGTMSFSHTHSGGLTVTLCLPLAKAVLPAAG